MNTEQFDGHIPGPWDYEIPETGDNIIIDSEGLFVAQVACRADCKNAELIAAAPALLAEVKRLEEQLVAYMDFLNWVAEEHNDVWDKYGGKDELYRPVPIAPHLNAELRRLRKENEELRAALGQRLRDFMGNFLKNKDRKRYR